MNQSEQPQTDREETIAFTAGRKARQQRIPLTKSALRSLRPGSRQYDDYIDGYDYEASLRKRKPKAEAEAER